MRNKRIIVSLLVTLFLIAGFVSPVFAGELNDLKIDVKLQDNGDAIVNSNWKYNDDKGTEHYIVIGNLGDSEIKDFKVSKNGKAYSRKANWNIKDSREQKKDRHGIVTKPSEFELCWGIGDYGSNDFQVSYRITKMVKNLNDAQMLNFRFVNDKLSEPPKSMELTISRNVPFTKEDVKMWAFGFKGKIELVDGKIVAKSDGPLNQNNFVTTLIRFNPGYFSTNSKVDKTFEQVKEKSFEGSDYKGDGKSSAPSRIEMFKNIISGAWKEGRAIRGFLIAFLVIFLGIIVGLICSIFRLIQSAVKSNPKSDRYISKRELELDGKYFREIPYKGKLDDIQFINSRISKGSSCGNFITAMFLKWIKEGVFVERKFEDGWIFKKEKVAFDISDNTSIDMGINESALFNIVKEAAGSDNSLESEEMSRWVRKNRRRFDNLYNNLSTISKDFLIDNHHMVVDKKETIFSAEEWHFTDSGKQILDNNIMFMNYLSDYSLLNEKESPNVHIWDEYMIYAAIYGITDAVKKEFKKLYPQYEVESVFSDESVTWASSFSSSMVSSYSSSGSDGFGGSSSFDGGGGSFGGGSGGGTR